MSAFLYENLVKELSDRIRRGIWLPGQRLPSIRKLSQQYDVAKVTVQTALHKLEASNLVRSKNRSGYYVVEQQETDVGARGAQLVFADSPKEVKVPELFYDIMAYSAAFDIAPMTEGAAADESTVILNRCINRNMRRGAYVKSHYYAPPEGAAALRRQLQIYYQQCNLAVDESQICLTGGCQNSLFLALSVVCQPGDTVAVESPAFYGVLQILQHLKLKVLEIPVSLTQGIKAEDLAHAAKTWSIKACVVSANFATPTGSLMPDSEKKQFVQVAGEHNIIVIEDDIYGDLGFNYRPDPLKTFDDGDNVILCSSFSKSVSRDLRTGWIIGGRHHQHIVRAKLINQLATPQAVQEGMAEFMAEGHFKRHIVQRRKALKEQLAQLLTILKQSWQCKFHYRVPEGGLCIWLELNKKCDTTKLFQRALIDQVVVTPGPLFTTSDKFRHCLRMSFAHPYTGIRKRALLRLGELLAS